MHVQTCREGTASFTVHSVKVLCTWPSEFQTPFTGWDLPFLYFPWMRLFLKKSGNEEEWALGQPLHLPGSFP